MKRFITSLVVVVGVASILQAIPTTPTFAIEENNTKLYKIESILQSSDGKVEKLVKIEIPEIPKIPIYDIPLSKDLQRYTYKLCKEMNIEYELALAIMKVESGYNEKTVSSTQDYGLMQLHKPYHKWHEQLSGIDNLNYLNPYQNIKAGLSVYKNSEDFWRDKVSDANLQAVALLGYNRGISGSVSYVKKYGIYQEYNRKVLEYKNQF